MYALTTRDALKASLDIAETARADRQIDAAIASATLTVEGHLKRRFRPELATRYFGWPALGQGSPWTLRLDADELASVTSLTAAGVAIVADDYFLEPRSGPPYTRIEIDLASSASFDAGDTHQRAIAVTGWWGHSDDARPAGSLAAAVLTSSATTVTVTDGSTVGVGDLLRVDDERLWVTERAWVDSTVDLAADLASSVGARTVTVTNGSGFHAGETILVGAEVLRIDAVTGNDLVCRRSWDGSVLGAHSSGASVYVSRSLTVERGAQGSTAVAHLIGAAVTAHVPPAPVVQLVQMEAMVEMGLGRSGGSSQSGEGGAAHDTSGPGLVGFRARVREGYGRKARMRSV